MMKDAAHIVIALSVLLFLPACAGRAPKTDSYGLRKAVAKRLVAMRDWNTAAAQIANLRAENPRDAELLMMRGMVYREKGLTSAAEADLTHALTMNPKLAQAHDALALLFATTQRPEKAEEHHRKAVELEPENVTFLNNLAFALVLGGRPREAISILRGAIPLAPDNPRLRNNLGFALAQVGDMRAAAREFARGGTPAEAKCNLGYAYERAGNHEQAALLYSEALALDATLVGAQVNLEHVQVLMGKSPGEESRE